MGKNKVKIISRIMSVDEFINADYVTDEGQAFKVVEVDEDELFNPDAVRIAGSFDEIVNNVISKAIEKENDFINWSAVDILNKKPNTVKFFKGYRDRDYCN